MLASVFYKIKVVFEQELKRTDNKFIKDFVLQTNDTKERE